MLIGSQYNYRLVELIYINYNNCIRMTKLVYTIYGRKLIIKTD